MLRKFKKYWNKEGQDFSKGLVDPFKYHSTFFKVLVLFRVADVEYKNKSKWFHQNTLLCFIACVGLMITLLSLFHGLDTFDIPLITEAGTYVLLLLYKQLILLSTKINLVEYRSLQEDMKKDFLYICTEGQKYRKKYFDNQLGTWKLGIFSCVFPMFIVIGMTIFTTVALIHFLVTHEEGDEGRRPLLFPFWFGDVDFLETPYFEVAFVVANICVLANGYNFIFNIQTQVVWIRHITAKVDIVLWCIEDLLDGVRPARTKAEYEYFSNLITTRMRNIVKLHQEMLSIMNIHAAVFKKILIFEQIVAGPIICLSAYCTAEKLDEGQFQLILPFIFFAAVVLHFIPSYFCNFLNEKVSSVCDACWDIPFWNATPVIRPYMVLIMQRSLLPLPLRAPGFKSISLETFANKMTTAYSTFNMLRQTNL